MNNYPDNCQDPNGNYPWNQDNSELDLVEKKVEVSISLSNTVTIQTNDYIPTIEEDYDVDIDEDGNRYVTGGKFESQDFSDTDWKKEYKKDECNIISLLQDYGRIIKSDIDIYTDRLKYAEEQLKDYPGNKIIIKKVNGLKWKIRLLNRKYKACNGYIIDDLEVFEA